MTDRSSETPAPDAESSTASVPETETETETQTQTQPAPAVASSWPISGGTDGSPAVAIGLPLLPRRAPATGPSTSTPNVEMPWIADPLRSLATVVEGLRASDVDPVLPVTGGLGSVGDRSIVWAVSQDGTRARIIAQDGVRVDGPWLAATGPVAEVLGAQQPLEMGILDESLTEGLVPTPVGRVSATEARRPGRPFGRFVPVRVEAPPSGLPGAPAVDGAPTAPASRRSRVVAVLGVMRRPGRPLFSRADQVVVDAVAERLEAGIANRLANAELRSSSTAGLAPSGNGVTLASGLLDRLGRISGDVVFRHLFSGRTEYVSAGVLASLGYEPAEIMADGGLLNRLIHPDDRHVLNEIADDPSRCDEPITMRMIRRNGQISWQYLRLAPIVAAGDVGDPTLVLGVEGFATDVTPLKQAEAELVHQARSDPLTGLANRLGFREAVSRAIARLERHEGMTGLLFLDLDGFKRVNDTYGHAAGDDVLRQVSETLRRVIRREDLVARLGGDEFAVLLSDLRSVEEGPATARRILAAFTDSPVMVGGHAAGVSTGIGIAVVTEPTTSPDELINRADIALYQAKRAGRGRWQVYAGSSGTASVDQPTLSGNSFEAEATSDGTTPTLSETLTGGSVAPRAMRRTRVSPQAAASDPTTGTDAADLSSTEGPEVSDATVRAALAARDFRVHYLPEVEASTGRVVAVEALLRWQHPTLGLLPASAFITEIVGLDAVHPLGDWALREATRQVATWRERYRLPLKLWINVVPAQLSQPGFADSVLTTITASGLSPRDVGLDLPEASLPSLDAIGEAALATLDRAGMRLAIDDFGTGSTSLRTLQRLPLHQLKIDRALIETVDKPNGTGSSDLVGMAVSLAGSLGAEVVAVGVERSTQLARVQALQCAYVQGFLAGHALSADEVEAMLRAAHPMLPGLDAV